MDIGMLWYDNDPKKALAEKVDQAASFYNKKYGKTPDLCFVHPSMTQDGRSQAGIVEIRASGSVLPNYFWIGVNEKQDGE
jgi:hypothetical protein